MEKQQRAALVYAGPVRRSSLIRLSGLPHQLEFIKSSSIATASRAVTALRAGLPVRHYDDLGAADLILISVPFAMVPKITSELLASRLDWNARTVILFDSECDSSVLNPMLCRGAFTGTLNWSANPERFLGEGHPEALRKMRTLVGERPLLMLRSKASYLRGERASRDDFYPIFASAVEMFQNAGIEKVIAEQTAAALFSESIRAWMRAGRRLLGRSGVK